jgi:HK97 family phage prohead protease
MKKNKHQITINNLEMRTTQGNDGQEQPVINGYAAVYNSESDMLYGFFREVIRPGAFDNSLGNDVRALWNHDSAYVLGRTTAGTLNIRSDAKGLYFEVMPPDTQWANDLCTSIQRGDINQMSFGFMVNQDNWESLEDGTEMRELLDVDLQEVSVVTFPAYQATSAGMRSLDSEDSEVKERMEKRKKQEVSEPDKRFVDYLKMVNEFDSRSGKGPQAKTDDADDESLDVDGDPDYDSDEDGNAKQKKRAKAVDDADGGEEEDPGTEADDPNNEDTTDDDEGDESDADGKPKQKRSKQQPPFNPWG